ncbi:cobyrinate a,c-diamide synthase [Marmoricola sp. OAE513]|uniref:cobyrinate a,c-diamide synthase n=1 Tax=Marmoricola sp. OAE513 TaxID=2817894 RepID=UPI001D431DF0
MTALPRLVVAAPSTGQGKTTVATGLMAALRGRGLEVSGHKVGPDYIDPGYHALATGRPGRNLDPHLLGEDLVVPLLLHGSQVPRSADIVVIEGVMGLYDGRLGTDGYASTAHVATLTGSPVVLVVDVARLSRSAGAIVAGMVAFDRDVAVAGVVLNRVGSERNTAEITRAVEQAGVPVLGRLPNDERLVTPSRHLGLVPAAERATAAELIEHLGEQVARHLDLDALLEVAHAAPALDASPWDPAAVVTARGTDRPVVAVAGGRAFTFAYAETTELLTAAGCEVVTFDPLTDTALPAGTRGIYLGGGFPEVYAADLAANTALLADLRRAVDAGTPTVAECAGLLYLGDTLDGVAMAGAVRADAAMAERLVLRYPEATAVADSLLTRAGEVVTGHEFHRTRTTPTAGESPAWSIEGEPTGFASATLHASYLHVHWAGHPQLAQRFADAVHGAPVAEAPSVVEPAHLPVVELAETPPVVETSPVVEPPSVVEPPPVVELAETPPPEPPVLDPLRHHGDRETAPDLLDFAVNVHAGPRPGWLDRALHRAVDESTTYPDSTPARAAVAAHHARDVADVLVTAGAAEAFTLVARLRDWTDPVVVHPQFTEPQAALEAAGHKTTAVHCRPEDGFRLDPAAIPESADLVVLGNPSNPTGVLHPATTIRALLRPGRVVLVDEAFMDAVPGEAESVASVALDGLLVVRSLTKHWAIPGIRAGYVVGDPTLVRELADLQPPWSVSTPAIAATVACAAPSAQPEAGARARDLVRWREDLERALTERGIEHVPSSASYVLARPGTGTREALRSRGVAVRRADTFPGLDDSWVRIAVRPPPLTSRLLAALDQIDPTRQESR